MLGRDSSRPINKSPNLSVVRSLKSVVINKISQIRIICAHNLKILVGNPDFIHILKL